MAIADFALPLRAPAETDIQWSVGEIDTSRLSSGYLAGCAGWNWLLARFAG